MFYNIPHTVSLARASRVCGRVCVCVCVCVTVCVAIAIISARAFSVSFNPLIYSYPQQKKIYKMEMRAQQGIL